MEFATPPLLSPVIGTKGLFSIMELPPELRVEIYNYLLVFPEPILIDLSAKGQSNSCSQLSPRYPSVAILQTCKSIDAEGTPILYSQNKFIFRLSLGLGPLAKSFIIDGLRWSTLSCLTSISFLSNATPLSEPPRQAPGLCTVGVRPRPCFTCTGAAILARFTEYDMKYSPTGPNRYMSLSIYNWVSLQVMREELSEFQTELEAMMAPT